MKYLATCAAAALTLTLAAPAQAVVVVDFTEVGSDVVMSFAGSIDTTGLTSDNIQSSSSSAFLGQNSNLSAFLNVFGTFNRFRSTNMVSPIMFADATSVISTSGSGDVFGVVFFGAGDVDNQLLLNDGYLSGTAISGTSLFAGQSFASLGVTDGSSFTTTFEADSVVVNFGTVAAVPLPATAPLILAGLGGLGLLRRRK